MLVKLGLLHRVAEAEGEGRGQAGVGRSSFQAEAEIRLEIYDPLLDKAEVADGRRQAGQQAQFVGVVGLERRGGPHGQHGPGRHFLPGIGPDLLHLFVPGRTHAGQDLGDAAVGRGLLQLDEFPGARGRRGLGQRDVEHGVERQPELAVARRAVLYRRTDGLEEPLSAFGQGLPAVGEPLFNPGPVERGRLQRRCGLESRGLGALPAAAALHRLDLFEIIQRGRGEIGVILRRKFVLHLEDFQRAGLAHLFGRAQRRHRPVEGGRYGADRAGGAGAPVGHFGDHRHLRRGLRRQRRNKNGKKYFFHKPLVQPSPII